MASRSVLFALLATLDSIRFINAALWKFTVCLHIAGSFFCPWIYLAQLYYTILKWQNNVVTLFQINAPIAQYIFIISNIIAELISIIK